MINEMMKILRINTYIQHENGTVILDGKTVTVVSLDRTWATSDAYDPDKPLTDEQLDNLFNQTLGLRKPTPERK